MEEKRLPAGVQLEGPEEETSEEEGDAGSLRMLRERMRMKEVARRGRGYSDCGKEEEEKSSSDGVSSGELERKCE